MVEVNGAWASGICGADPAKVLPVLARATMQRADVTDADRPSVRPPAELF